MKRQAFSSGTDAGYGAAAAPWEASRPRPRVLVTPPAFLVVVLGMTTFITSFVTPADYDYWWHIADGRYILATHTLPSPDRFSFTVAGHSYVAHEWLAEVPMYLLHQAFGMRGPVALFAVCMVAVALLTFATLRQLGLRGGSAFALTCLMLAAMHMFTGPRPQVAGFALMAALLWLLERWMVRRDGSIWALPVLIWLWGNLHGSFAIGLAVPVLVLAGELIASWLRWDDATRLGRRDRLQLAGAIAASALLLLVNPNGAQLLLYPLSKLHDPLARQYLGEWAAIDISDPFYWPFALLVGGFAGLAIVRRPCLALSDLLLGLALIGAGLSTAKYVPFAATVLVMLIGRVLTQPNRGGAHTPSLIARLAAWRGQRTRPHSPPTVARQAIYLLELLVLAGALVLTVQRTDPMVHARMQLPVEAVDTLGANGLPARLFNYYSWGGYLIWRLWPQSRVFIDGRGDDLYLKSGDFRRYFDVVELTSTADAVLDQYHIQTVLFPKDAKLTRYLLAGGKWQATYDDGRVVKLERRAPDIVLGRPPRAARP